MKQKIIKIGNSQGIILPKEALDAAGLKPGETVYITPDPAAGTLMVSDKKVSSYTVNSAKFAKIIEDLNDEYKEDLKELAGK